MFLKIEKTVSVNDLIKEMESDLEMCKNNSYDEFLQRVELEQNKGRIQVLERYLKELKRT